MQGAVASATVPAVTHTNELAEADQWEADAFAAIEQVQDPGEAESLLRKVATVAEAMRLSEVAGDRERRWMALKLKAEHRWGVLLGEAEHGGNRKSDQVSDANLKGAERVARNQARKVAKVPVEKLDAYVAKEQKPTRAGLLKDALPPPKPRPKPTKKDDPLPPPDEAIERLRERVRYLRTLDRDVTRRWNNRDMNDVEAVLKQAQKRRPRYSGKRLRENSALRTKLARKSVADLQFRILQMTATLETSDIGDYDLAGEDAFAVNELYDDLVELQLWMDRTLSVTRAHMDDAHEFEKIRKLREDHSGDTR